ncbi:MAG: transcription antitermination factor NusB [Parvibaculaceae bacterium]|nr:transcription antitermination factor NusB [Parvibaculaceae bacterium]
MVATICQLSFCVMARSAPVNCMKPVSEVMALKGAMSARVQKRRRSRAVSISIILLFPWRCPCSNPLMTEWRENEKRPVENPDAASTGSAARTAAATLVDAVLSRGRALDEAFEAEAARGLLRDLPGRDRAFARAIATVTLRRLGQIDFILGQFLEKPLHKRSGLTRDLLRTATAEMLFLGVKPHAAVASAVDAAAADEAARHFKGLVNAVLRKVARQGAEVLASMGAEGLALNTPRWLRESWQAAYGESAALAIAEAHLKEPPLDLSLKPGLDAHEWAGRLGATLLPTGSLRLHQAARVEALDGFEEGAWWVQDAAAALPARLLGDVEGREVLDLCAAPGGKTAELAAAGAHVTAVDRSAKRLERLSQNLARLKLSAEVVVSDVLAFEPGRTWDFILLDAPCSATGTVRRHPDVALLKRPTDRDKLVRLQGELLKKAAGLLNPGGTLIYCTCSLEPEEGIRQIEAFLVASPAFSRRPVMAPELGGCGELVSAEGDLRTLPGHWPEQGGLDGFFAARLVKS